jgi:hypothetical protein
LQRNIRLVVADIQVKTCSKCQKEKALSCFRSRGGNQKHLLKSRCNTCLYEEHFRWTTENKERVGEYRQKDKWTIVKRCSRRGITPQEFVEAYEAQNGKCPICASAISMENSAIDHNHETGAFRGILCKTCNRALGMFKDSPEILVSASQYLKERGSYQCHSNPSSAV